MFLADRILRTRFGEGVALTPFDHIGFFHTSIARQSRFGYHFIKYGELSNLRLLSLENGHL